MTEQHWYEFDPEVEAFSTINGDTLPYDVVTAYQVHGFRVAKITDPGITREELQDYDALMTNIPGCAIGVRSADCVPLLFHDPVHKAVAAAHSGWKGTVQKISQKTIIAMMREYGTRPDDVKVIIGPSISKKCFQVGNEVIQFFKEAGFPMEQIWSWDGVRQEGSYEGGHHINLVEASKWLLTEFGVKKENIFESGICSYSDERFFSARRDGYNTGRTISAIKLK